MGALAFLLLGTAGSDAVAGTLEIYEGTINIRPLGAPDIARGSDNVIELVALHGELAGLYPPDATVVFSLTDPTGAPVSNATNITMAHVSGTTGSATTYRGELPASVSATLATRLIYTLTVTAIDASANKRVFELPCAVLPG